MFLLSKSSTAPTAWMPERVVILPMRSSFTLPAAARWKASMSLDIFVLAFNRSSMAWAGSAAPLSKARMLAS